MNTRKAIAPRARWRDRFLEIARQVEGRDAAQSIRPMAGLRLRARLSRRLPTAPGSGAQLA